MAAPSLRSARQLLRARRFPDVIRLLEPEVFRYRENTEYFLILGTSCLHAGDLGGATSYLSRARQLAPGTVEALLGLAAVHLKRGEHDQALKLWLEALEEDPGNAIARRGMNMLRKGLSHEALQDLIDSGRLRTLYPPVAGTPRWVRWAIAALAVAVLAGGGLLSWRVLRPTPRARPQVAGIVLPAGGAVLVDPAESALFTMGERDVARVFGEAKQNLLAWRDNPAIVDLNRILASNASLGVKERARILKGLTVPATFDTLQARYSFREVAAQPVLYDGCTVAWQGKVANLAVSAEAITFDLLVGYQQERELQGIVPVRLGFAADIDNGIAMEVLGKVVVDGKAIRLEGLALHRLLP